MRMVCILTKRGRNKMRSQLLRLMVDIIEHIFWIVKIKIIRLTIYCYLNVSSFLAKTTILC